MNKKKFIFFDKEELRIFEELRLIINSMILSERNVILELEFFEELES